jgi:hypothetical protein
MCLVNSVGEKELNLKLQKNFQEIGVIIGSLAMGEDLNKMNKQDLEIKLNQFLMCCSFNLSFIFRKFDFFNKNVNEENFKRNLKSINQMVLKKTKKVKNVKALVKEKKTKKIKVKIFF